MSRKKHPHYYTRKPEKPVEPKKEPVDYDAKYSSFSRQGAWDYDFSFLGSLLKTIDILQHEKLNFFHKAWLIIKLPFLIIATLLDFALLLLRTIFLSGFMLFCIILMGLILYSMFKI